MTTATTVTVDRDVIERFIVEVDALAMFESMRAGNQHTWLVEHIYRVLDELEKTLGLDLSNEESDALHYRGLNRGRDVFLQFIADLNLDDD